MTEKVVPKSDACVEDDTIVEFPQDRATAPKSLAANERVNRNEVISIKALTGYVAHNKNVPENVVSAYLQAEFKVADITDLRREEFERVIQFLVDLREEILIN
jgi:hypothetical protein